MNEAQRGVLHAPTLVRHLTSSVLLFDKDRVLLVFHPKLHVWIYPGGHVEPNESPAECALREVEEETGLRVELLPKAPTQFPHAQVTPWTTVVHSLPDGKEPAHEHIDCVFLARLEDRTVLSGVLDGQRAAPELTTRWVTLSELSDLALPDNFETMAQTGYALWLSLPDSVPNED